MINPRKPSAALAATLLGAGLALMAPPTASAAPCTDTIEGWESVELSVGIKHTKTMYLGVTTAEDCGAAGATATIKDPVRGAQKVTLTPESDSEGHVRWTGEYKVSPKKLTNGDAGTWPITYAVTGPSPDSVSIGAPVRRAVRGSFNAGPEPVENGRITFSGKVERASWTNKKYYGLSRDLEVSYVPKGEDEAEPVVVSTPRSNKAGKYRVTQHYPGPGAYQVTWGGSRTTSPFASRADRVDTEA